MSLADAQQDFQDAVKTMFEESDKLEQQVQELKQRIDAVLETLSPGTWEYEVLAGEVQE